ncbi:MAG: hypothetical protein Kow0013_10230 [Pararhodobacter sp.]
MASSCARPPPPSRRRTLTTGERDLLDRLTWIVIVRAAFSRTLSAIPDKFREPRNQRKHGAFPLTPQGFLGSLRALAAGGQNKDGHRDLQTKLIVGPLDRFDAVLRFEILGADLEAALSGAGIPFDAERLKRAYPSDERKSTGASARLAQVCTPEAEALVARLHAADFQALGYPAAVARGTVPLPHREARAKTLCKTRRRARPWATLRTSPAGENRHWPACVATW